MGSGESRPTNSSPSDNIPKVVKIDRSEIPEAYSRVRLSNNVIQRLAEEKSHVDTHSSTLPTVDSGDTSPEQNVQQSTTHSVSEQNIEEAKRVFRETVEKVEKQFSNYHRENACAESEKAIIDCLAANTNRVLLCSPLWQPYNRCIDEFHQAVLKEKIDGSLPAFEPEKSTA